jgi:uroporphyrinogen-III synthase
MKIFITRTLKKDSIFKTELESRGHLVFGQSLIEFEALDFAPLAEEDWLFFYSKRGIDYLLKKYKPNELSSYKIATIGSATAKYLAAKYYLKVDFQGSGHPNQTAAQFLKLAKGQKVAFIRASNSKMSVQLLLKEELIISDYVVYENKMKTNFKLEERDIVVFTSPMNAEAYYQQYHFSTAQYYVAIGQTTAKKLKKLGLEDFEIAAQPSEEELMKSVKKIIAQINAH